ncbi:MAG: cis-3-alkyl-4-acyloxetan-2-one decarboxylase / olefin beta-lactone synthetase [Nocardioidaceae bacterium]|nr:cis-3-alkyl-4-acyloxetan-2-one decarboxylase / olefin beta-lactone synthetase [Nocardioidaceae bacterium]
MTGDARHPPPNLPGLDPTWSRLVTVAGEAGTKQTWHVLDNAVADPELTLLCVHGNPTWSYLWRRLFSAVPSTWRVVAPDQLGMGYSDRPSEPRTLAQRVSDLDRLTDALGVDGATVTVAHDWGGPISLGWACRHRERLRGVVLLNTAVHLPAGDVGPALIRLADLPGLRGLVCARTPAFVRAATSLSRPALPRAVRDAYAAPYAAASRRRAVADFVADIPFSARHPSRPALDDIALATRSLDVPALLLWGPRDPVFAERFLDDLRDRLPGADLHRYEQASHLVTEDAPRYAESVVEWVRDRASSTAPAAVSAPTGVPAVLAAPPLGARLVARAGDHRPAVVDLGGCTVSWDLLDRRVREIAAGLVATGVRRGERVALLVPPSADLTAAVYAVWRAGAVIVVADKGLGVRAMGRALRGARVDHVIATAQGLAAARAMRLPGRRIAAGAAPGPLLRALGAGMTLSDLARIGRSAPEPPATPADDACAVVFTSGATGPPKGVVYRHRQVQAQLELVRSTYALTDDDRLVAAFAPFSLFGPALGIGSAVPDMDVTAPGTLTAVALADAVQAIDATVVFASPAALRNVVATAGTLSAAQRTALARVRLLMSAGAPVPIGLLQALSDLLPNADARTPYGMTEALPVTDVSLNELLAAGEGEGVCVGRPLPGVEVAVSALSESGQATGDLTSDPGVSGEICVRAPHVKDRYDALWATQRASSRDGPGWHRTGDVGHLDTERRLWVEGRLEHVITTASGVVTPVGVEQRVEGLAQVRAAAAVGVGPAGTQQVVVVVVPFSEPSRWSSVAPLDLSDTVRRAAGVEVAAVLVVRELPVDIRHASKVDRRKLALWASRVLAGAGTRRSS